MLAAPNTNLSSVALAKLERRTPNAKRAPVLGTAKVKDRAMMLWRLMRRSSVAGLTQLGTSREVK
jgi:hypothetical protein